MTAFVRHLAPPSLTARLDDELAPRAPEIPGIARDRLASHGIVDQDAIGAIAAQVIAAVRVRAASLLDDTRQRRSATAIGATASARADRRA
jgi:hypothetical protein